MQITIDGMSCKHCVKAVEDALKEVPGIKNLKVEIGKASFDAQNGFNEAQAKSVIDEAGYSVIKIG